MSTVCYKGKAGTLSFICSFVMSVHTALTELSMCELSFARNFPTFGTKETSQ